MLAPKEELQEQVQKQLAKLKQGDIFETERRIDLFVKHTDTPGLEIVRNLSSQASRQHLANGNGVPVKIVDFRESVTFNKLNQGA